VRTLVILGLAVGLALGCWGQQPGEMQPSVTPPNPEGGSTVRTVHGVVVNGKGAPVPGAIVLLKDMKTLQVRSFIAQQDGKYRFYGLNPDVNYQLRAEYQGQTSKTKTVSVFDSRKMVKLDLKLSKKMKS
jgi:hypothetical protein